jgi:hypothetical protein
MSPDIRQGLDLKRVERALRLESRGMHSVALNAERSPAFLHYAEKRQEITAFHYEAMGVALAALADEVRAEAESYLEPATGETA